MNDQFIKICLCVAGLGLSACAGTGATPTVSGQDNTEQSLRQSATRAAPTGAQTVTVRGNPDQPDKAIGEPDGVIMSGPDNDGF